MKRQVGPWVRWAWLATTIAMGAVLIATAYVSRNRAIAAATTLNRGQSLVLFESIRQQARGMSEPPAQAQLDTLLRQHNAAGLRYIAFFDSAGTVLAQAGTPAASKALCTGAEVAVSRGGFARRRGFIGEEESTDAIRAEVSASTAITPEILKFLNWGAARQSTAALCALRGPEQPRAMT